MLVGVCVQKRNAPQYIPSNLKNGNKHETHLVTTRNNRNRSPTHPKLKMGTSLLNPQVAGLWPQVPREGLTDTGLSTCLGGLHSPVYPICHSTSACSVWATWRGMALSSRLLECRPVACQKPEPKDKLALRSGRDDCHFWLHRVSLQGMRASARVEEEDDQNQREEAYTLSCGKATTLQT